MSAVWERRPRRALREVKPRDVEPRDFLLVEDLDDELRVRSTLVEVLRVQSLGNGRYRIRLVGMPGQRDRIVSAKASLWVEKGELP